MSTTAKKAAPIKKDGAKSTEVAKTAPESPAIDLSKQCDKHAECVLALHHPGSCRRADGTIIAKNRETVEVAPPASEAPANARHQKVHVSAGTMTAHNWRTAGFPIWCGYGVNADGNITHYLGDMGIIAGFQDIEKSVRVSDDTVRLVFRCSRRMVEIDAK